MAWWWLTTFKKYIFIDYAITVFPIFPLYPPFYPASHNPPAFPPLVHVHGLYVYKFFESSVSYTIFYLSLRILWLLIMLLLPCTFPPHSSLPSPHWNPSMWYPFLWFCSCSGWFFSFCFHCFSFLLGSFVDSCEFVVIFLFIVLIFFYSLEKSL